jgi:hypothetical protein
MLSFPIYHYYLIFSWVDKNSGLPKVIKQRATCQVIPTDADVWAVIFRELLNRLMIKNKNPG